MISTSTYYYGLVTAMYVMAGLLIAAIRWFHMCRPYNRYPDYYYPGRKATTVSYLSTIFLLPYLFFPESNGAWLLLKAYFLPMILYFMAILLFSYFGGVMHWHKWRLPTWILGGVSLLALVAAPAATLLKVTGNGLSGIRLGNTVILGLGVVMTVFCYCAVKTVLHWTRQFDVEEYSNPADFPVNFARKMVRTLMVSVVLLWVAALSDSREVMALMQLLMIAASAWMLISALHPQRKGVPEQAEELLGKEARASKIYSYKITPAKAKAITAAIRKEMEQAQAFLEPHLTLQDVATRCGFNRTYVAGILKSEFGGFFHYVNSLRLQYAEEYHAAHPKASIAEIADASGFGSRQSYYSVKETLGKQVPESPIQS